jgi:hypothetical protein
MFQQVRWYFLQFVVAVGVFACIELTVGAKEFGLAPAIVAMAAAWGVTALASYLIDLRRRRARIRQQLKSGAGCGVALGHAGDGPELVRRPRIGQNPRKLI